MPGSSATTTKLRARSRICCESFTVEEDRIFTFKIREGHRWSDGNPFTSEDFRYCWEDVIHNEDLRAGGLPLRAARATASRRVFEVVDDYTVRYTWRRPTRISCRSSPRPSRSSW